MRLPIIGDKVRIVNNGTHAPDLGAIGMVGQVTHVDSAGWQINAYFQYDEARRRLLRGWSGNRMGSGLYQTTWALKSGQWELFEKILSKEEKQTLDELKAKGKLSPVEDFIVFGLES